MDKKGVEKMIKEKKIRKDEFLIFLFFGIISFFKGIGLEGNNVVYILAYAFGAIMAITKIFKDKLKSKEFFAILSIMIIGVIDFIIGNTTTILFTAITLCCLKNIDLKKLIKIIFYSKLISFIIMMFLSTSGIIENNYILHYREGVEFVKRYTFGYPHPNQAHMAFSLIVLIGGYLYYEKITIPKVLLLEVANYIMFCYTQSRTGFIVIFLYLIVLVLAKKIGIIKKVIAKLPNISFILFISLSFILAKLYSTNSLVQNLDSILTGRIRYMSILIENYNFPIIGNEMYNNYVLFDNGYFSLLYEGGIIAFAIFFYFAYKSNKILTKNNLIPESILVIFMSFYCMFESIYANSIMNPAILFFALSIYKNEIKDDKIDNKIRR